MFMHRSICIILSAALASSVAGCGHASISPLRVRAFDARPWPPLEPGQGLIIDFKAGDRIPVSIQADGDIVEATPNPSTIWLTAKRDFALRIRGSEVKTSLYGDQFDDKPAVPGHFQFGIQATRQGGVKVVVQVTTPLHAKP